MTTTKAELFAAYGDDLDALLDAWPNLDPEGYAHWMATCERRQLNADYRAWLRTQITTVEREATKRASGQDPMFDVPAKKLPGVEVRSVLIHDGETVDLLSLAGEEGAAVLERIAKRDRPAAATTLTRCNDLDNLAGRVRECSEAEGRPVSVAEVLGLAVAS